MPFFQLKTLQSRKLRKIRANNLQLCKLEKKAFIFHLYLFWTTPRATFSVLGAKWAKMLVFRKTLPGKTCFAPCSNAPMRPSAFKFGIIGLTTSKQKSVDQIFDMFPLPHKITSNYFIPQNKNKKSTTHCCFLLPQIGRNFAQTTQNWFYDHYTQKIFDTFFQSWVLGL